MIWPSGSRRLFVTWITSLVLAAITMDCGTAQAPKLTSLRPSNGTERSLVLVQGERLESGVVIWDAGLPSEKQLPASVQGATMISIPPHSTPGTHPVAIESPAGRSAIANFVVDGPAPAAVPRIDFVTLADTQFDSDDKVRVILYVQGANIDVGAKVLVDGTEIPSKAHKAIYNNLFGAHPATLGFPIRHYL